MKKKFSANISNLCFVLISEFLMMFTKKEEVNVTFIVIGSTIATCTFSHLGIPLYLSGSSTYSYLA